MRRLMTLEHTEQGEGSHTRSGGSAGAKSVRPISHERSFG